MKSIVTNYWYLYWQYISTAILVLVSVVLSAVN